MPTTRRQAALQKLETDKKPTRDEEVNVDVTNAGDKRTVEKAIKDETAESNEHPTKKSKTKSESDGEHAAVNGATYDWQIGTIERGHIYFFYRPKVQLENAETIDDVRNLHMLLVPRPPEFGVHDGSESNTKQEQPHDEDTEMTLLARGSDAIPARATVNQTKKRYRLITVGKKQLPDPSAGGAGKGRKDTFWAAVTAVGDDLDSLERGLGEKSYETKTRGTRHEEPARLAARGVYAIVNNDPRVPSKRETHLGYHLSHPTELGDVQHSLGIYEASSFVLQIKNPLAPDTGRQRGMSAGRKARYPEEIMHGVFGKGGSKGRESYGLRFVSCERTELLDYEGAELLLIAARGGKEGIETSMGDGRGEALNKAAEKEGGESVQRVFRELAMDEKVFPADALKGEWI